MMQVDLEARRQALRSEIAVTRAALGSETAQLRADMKWALIASAAMRLAPKRFRWVGIAAGLLGAIAMLRRRGAG
jgi:hypothetical protein